MVNIGEKHKTISMLGRIICKIKREHMWNENDFDEFTDDMEIGDEVTTNCKRCGKRMATIERLNDDSIRWEAHDPQAYFYQLTDKGKKLLANEDFRRGLQTKLDKFQEDYK